MRRVSAALRQAQARQMKLEQWSIVDAGRRQRLQDALWELVWAVESGIQGRVESAMTAARVRLEE
jgi:hypothetical protein